MVLTASTVLRQTQKLITILILLKILMSDFQIRGFAQSDFPQVVNLLFDFQDLIGNTGKQSGKRPFTSLVEAEAYLKQALKDVDQMNGFFLVAEAESKIVGFIYGVIVDNQVDTLTRLTHTKEKEGWIGIVYVTSDYRGLGIGKQLIQEGKNCLKKAGCNSVRLIVDSGNPVAIETYLKLGFVEYEKKLMLAI